MAAQSDDRSTRAYGQGDIEPRPIPLFPPRPLSIQTLPEWVNGIEPPKVSVTLFDRTRFYIAEVFEYTGWAAFLLGMTIRTIIIIQTGGSMGILKIAGRITKMIGAAVGLGGWALSFISPEVGAIIAGCALILGDAIVMAGDIIDDGKLNKSFTID